MNALAIAAVAACMGWSVQSFGYAAMPHEFGGGVISGGLVSTLGRINRRAKGSFLGRVE